jgi:hypothetical protein
MDLVIIDGSAEVRRFPQYTGHVPRRKEQVAIQMHDNYVYTYDVKSVRTNLALKQIEVNVEYAHSR